MVGRITAVVVVAFWTVMMAALVRMEYLGELGGTEVPAELVLRKVFSQESPARLNVLHEGQVIGFCKVDVERPPATALTEAAAAGDALLAGPGYQVHTELTLALANFGIPSRLRIIGHTQFSPTFEVEAFKINTTIGDGRVEVRGQSATQKLTVDFSIGEYRDHREFDYQQLRAAGLQSILGMAGLANMGLLGGTGMEALPPSVTSGAASGKKITSVRTSRLRIAGEAEETYLIETRLDESMWARIWISKQGEVLKVDTSMRVTLLADTLTEIQSRYPDEDKDDSH